MAKIQVICGYCSNPAMIEKGAVNRAKGRGVKIYCGKVCAGLARRSKLNTAERKAMKSAYDKVYRAKNKAIIKVKRKVSFQKDYQANPEKYRLQRKARKTKHAEYCRQPEYRKKKHQYDRKRYAKAKFGDLWEIHVLAMNITEESQKQQTKFEMMQSKGTINKAQKRKREYAKTQRC